MIKNLLLMTITAVLLIGCGGRSSTTWTGWIYPDKTNTRRSMEIGQFPSLEKCRAAAKDKLEALDISQRGDYKCGLGCGYNEGLNTLVCEKTTK